MEKNQKKNQKKNQRKNSIIFGVVAFGVVAVGVVAFGVVVGFVFGVVIQLHIAGTKIKLYYSLT